ncbi:MAG: AAA family ATPase [Myxococcales bacterium]|nr:AAA family ATPase [Myxococcales bacterium]
MASRFHHELLRSARLDLEMTQEEAATALGVDVRTYRRYESGAVNSAGRGFEVRTAARRRFLARACSQFGLDAQELVVAPPSDAADETDEGDQGDEGDEADGERARDGLDDVVDRDPRPRDDRGWRPMWTHVLQRARHFVGRDALVDALVTWAEADAPRDRVIALVGPGGAGKTSVAERVAAELGTRSRPGGLFVWCFFDQPRVESFLSAALAYFARDEGEAATSSLPGERLERLESALRRGPPHLLVLDGLEAVQSEGRDPGAPGGAFGELEDPLLRRFARALVHGLGRARALVTTRFPLAALAAWEGDGLRTRALEPLTTAEGTQLLRRWGVLDRGDRDAGGEASEDAAGELAALVTRVGGHPLSLAVLGSYATAFLDGDPRRVAELPLAEAALAEAARDDPLARQLAGLLGAYARALPELERDLLARISVFPRGVDRDVLEDMSNAVAPVAGALAGRARAELTRALRRLERLGLVFSTAPARPPGGAASPCYSAHPFVRQYFAGLLGAAATDVHAEVIARIERSLQGTGLRDRGRARPREPALLDALEDLLLHTLEQGRPTVAFGLYVHALGGFDWLGLVLGEMARGARIARAFAAGGTPQAIDARLPVGHRILLAYQWGLYSGALGDLAGARRCYELVVVEAEAHGDINWRVTSLRALAYTARLAGRTDAALERVRASIELARARIGGRQGAEHIVRGLALEGAILQDRGDLEGASARFARLPQLGDRPVARRGLWVAEHELARGQLAEAEARARDNLARCARLGWDGHVAHCHAVLAEVALAYMSKESSNSQGARLDEASSHLAALERWTRRTGRSSSSCARQLAGALALARGELAAAREAIDRRL